MNVKKEYIISNIEKTIETGVEIGIRNAFIKATTYLAAAVFVLSCVIYFFPPEKESTDPVDGRSGLEIKIDAMTGCQYLTTQKGGLTPRVDVSGKQICGDAK